MQPHWPQTKKVRQLSLATDLKSCECLEDSIDTLSPVKLAQLLARQHLLDGVYVLQPCIGLYMQKDLGHDIVF